MNKLRKRLYLIIICICGISFNAFASSNIDVASVQVVNLTDNIMIRDYAKEIIDKNNIPYKTIAELYNQIISNRNDLLFRYDGKSLISASQKYQDDKLITVRIIKKTKVIEGVSIEYDEK
ncbi:hypothetical protein [Fastidiosibacter lacustris]|uniref:hypothetical protein n=1 Tax=Fastidiosibacter lacustris TaxID=2056695 RepID=UPI000E350D65|nr:hypothetical protein [Fastidiosibacter lacustris]